MDDPSISQEEDAIERPFLSNKMKYLVCVSDSEHSRVAIKYACNQALHTNSVIELLYVIEPSDFRSIMAIADKIDEEQRQEAEQLMHDLASVATEWSSKMIPSFQIRQGDVAEEIMNAIEEDEAVTMVIMGTAADSPSRDTLLPELVEHIGERLMIPMLIIPGTMTDHQIKQLTGIDREI